MQQDMITGTFELPGYRVAKNLGIVRGITVRSRSVVGNLLCGDITVCTNLWEEKGSE